MKNKTKGFFDYEFRQEKLGTYKDPLQTLDGLIEWESFRTIIEGAFPEVDYSKGGRPPYDKLMLFKVLILQSYYNLSDHQTEFQIADRITFMRFLGIELYQSVPDSNTIRNFREVLTSTGVIDQVFVAFGQRLNDAGLILKEGSIHDATFVTAPRQRNSREENKLLKEDQTPPDWSDKKLSHKDVEAKWTKKNGQVYFGYKNHIKADIGSKLIIDFETTAAHVHDGEVFEELLSPLDSGKPIYGDSAYQSMDKETMLKKNEIVSQIHEKGARNHPLTEEQKKSNRLKSTIRAQVEHPFGWMHRNCKELMVKTIGLARATAKITLLNLVYNMHRATYLIKLQGRTMPI